MAVPVLKGEFPYNRRHLSIQNLQRVPSMTPVVMIAGAGIGPEVRDATRKILQAAGARVDWIEAPAGLAAVDRYAEPLPDATLDLIRKHRVALKGPCTTPIGKGYRSINVRLRRELE